MGKKKDCTKIVFLIYYSQQHYKHKNAVILCSHSTPLCEGLKKI